MCCYSCVYCIAQGTCGFVSVGTSCGSAGYVCSGSSAACPSTCSGTTGCDSSHYCSGSSCLRACILLLVCGGTFLVLDSVERAWFPMRNRCFVFNWLLFGRRSLLRFCVYGCLQSVCNGRFIHVHEISMIHCVQGTCGLAASGTFCGSGFVCSGSSASCPSSCSNDNQCDSTHYCSSGSCMRMFPCLLSFTLLVIVVCFSQDG